MYIKKVVSLYGASPYCLFPGCIITWAWSLAKGQYMVSWLLTGAPEQRYWQNRETVNVGLDSWVGRAPAHQSGGRRFKSRSRKFFFVHPYIPVLTSKRKRDSGILGMKFSWDVGHFVLCQSSTKTAWYKTEEWNLQSLTWSFAWWRG